MLITLLKYIIFMEMEKQERKKEEKDTGDSFLMCLQTTRPTLAAENSGQVSYTWQGLNYRNHDPVGGVSPGALYQEARTGHRHNLNINT